MKGFTLVELMVTLTVAAVLILFAVPNMRTMIQNNRISTLSNDLVSDINAARSEALRRSGNIGLCTSSSGNGCDGGGSWQGGRVIFADTNGNTLLDAGEPVIRTREAFGPTNTLTASNMPDPLIFNSRGVVANAVPGLAPSFAVCDDRGTQHGKLVQVSPIGQPSISKTPPPGC